MIKKDYEELYSYANTITKEISSLCKALYAILQSDKKNYSIEFKGKRFEFHPATDRDWETI